MRGKTLVRIGLAHLIAHIVGFYISLTFDCKQFSYSDLSHLTKDYEQYFLDLST